MTRRSLYFRVSMITLYYFTLIIIAAFGYGKSNSEIDYYARFIKDFAPILTALPAAFLAYSIQKRLSFLKEIRENYDTSIKAVENAIYYMSPAADITKKQAVLIDLSIAIESVRGVLTDKNSTDYPVIGLKKIFDIVAKFDDPNSWREKRKEIAETWKVTRRVFLDQMDTVDHGLTYKDQYIALSKQ